MRKKKEIKKPPRNDTSSKAKKSAAKKAKTARKGAAPKTRNNGTFSESQYFQKIRSALRNGFRYYKPMMQALELASRPNQSSNTRLKKEYLCNECENWFPRKAVQVDHKIACGSLSCYEDIVPFIKRLTAENVSDYQILCSSCHSIKTAQEKEERKNGKIQIQNS